MRAVFDPGPAHQGWVWETYTHSKTRHAGMASTGWLDDYQYKRWETAEDALEEARGLLLHWERDRPGF